MEIGYLITDEALTEAKCTKRDFTPYTEPLKLNTDGRYAVYAKLTNAVGNVTYLSSDGIVLDTTPPEINGFEDGKTYYGDRDIYAQATDENLASFSVNGSPIEVFLGGSTSARFSFLLGKNCTYKFIATDKAGNVTEKTATFYDGTYVVPVTGVSLDESSITLDVGGNQTLTATVTPEDATNKKVRWSSDNEAVATVSEDGVVTARKENGATEFIAVNLGVANVVHNEVTLLVRTAERAENIDLPRAEAAEKRARDRLAERGANLDVKRAQIALHRSLTRQAAVLMMKGR